MISIKNNFLFVHIPKTGGNSIQQILMNYSEDAVVTNTEGQDGVNRFEVINNRYRTHKHTSLWYYNLVLPRPLFSKLFKFAIIRNPWDRAISFYFSPHRNVTTWDRSQFLDTLPEVRPVGYYLRMIHPILYRLKCKLHFPARTIDTDLNFIMRFESLEQDFQQVCEKIKIPIQSLNHRNRSAHEHYSKYYDKELVDIVWKRYQEEIDWAGYEFEKI